MTSAPSPGGPTWQHEPAASHQAERPASSSFFRWIRGLDITRTPDRWVGGVAGGVAHRTGLDLALVRGLIVVLAVFGGLGVLLYGLAWALLPEPDGRIHVEQAGRGSWTSGLTGAAALVAVGLWRSNFSLHGDGGGGLLWTLFWIGAGVLFVYWIVDRSGKGGARPGKPYPGSPGGGAGQPPTQPFGPAPYAPAEPPARPAPGPSSGSSGTGDGPLGAPGASGAAAFSGDRTTGADPGHLDDGPGQDSAAASSQLSPEPGTESYPQPYAPASPLPYQPAPWAAWSDYPAADTAWGPGGPDSIPPAIRDHQVRTRPSGSVTALLLGGATITAAVLLALDYSGVLDLANAAAVALAAAAVVLALGIVALGVRGRSSGLVGVTAALATIGALIASLTIVGGSWVVAQETSTSPASLQTASDGYSIMASEATIDLADLPAPVRDVVIPVNSLASDVTVVVPQDVPVEVRARMALANADARGTTSDPDLLSPAFRGEGGVLQLGTGELNPEATGPALILDVRGALSNVTILTATGTGTDGAFPPETTGTTPTGDTP